MIEETWNELDNHHKYQVSNLGRVKRVRVTIAHGKSSSRTLRERILKQTFTHNGWIVGIQNDQGENYNEVVARLILTAFIRPPVKDEVARHLDDNKLNQSLGNLAWGKQYDNIQDAIRNGKTSRGERNGVSKLDNDIVAEIRKVYKACSREFGQCALARKFNVNQSTIHHVVYQKTWR